MLLNKTVNYQFALALDFIKFANLITKITTTYGKSF